jgi:hypothetical protein
VRIPCHMPEARVLHASVPVFTRLPNIGVSQYIGVPHRVTSQKGAGSNPDQAPMHRAVFRRFPSEKRCRRTLYMSQYSWAQQFCEPWLFSAPELTDL